MPHESEEKIPDSVLMPAPTAWPVVTAFGIAMVCLGLVTHPAVGVIGGLILLRGAVGWWRDVLPHEKHESMPVAAEPERMARPVEVSTRAVMHLEPGAGDHRVRIPAEMHPYSAGVIGGLAGGAAMAVVATIFGLISQGSLWYPINLLAAGLLRSLASADVEQLRQFSARALLVGTIIHGTFSILVGVLYAVLLPMFPRRAGLWSGLITPIVWSGLIAATLDIINPALNARVDWKWFVASQIAFGLVAGYVVARTQQIHTRQSWPLMARAGIEAQQREESK